MAPLHLSGVTKGSPAIHGWKCLLWLTSSSRLWTTTHVVDYLSWSTSVDQKQSKRQKKDCWPELRRKLPAKGMFPLREYLSFEQEFILSPPSWKTGMLSWRWLHKIWIPSSWLSSCPSVSLDGGVPAALARGKETRLGHLAHRKTCTILTFTQVNSEDKGGLDKLVEAFRISYKDRYNEIHHHWRGSVLGRKSVSWIVQLEKKKS